MNEHDTWVNPVGGTAAEAGAERATRSRAYRRARESIAGGHDLAWMLVRHRMERGLTQQQLAAEIGTSYSQISRIESGTHTPNLDTLMRIADALGRRLVLGFEYDSRLRGKRSRSFDVEAPEEPPDTRLGIELANLRERRGLHRDALARRCGLRSSVIERIEQGEKDPTVGTVGTLLQVLEASLQIDAEGQVEITPVTEGVEQAFDESTWAWHAAADSGTVGLSVEEVIGQPEVDQEVIAAGAQPVATHQSRAGMRRKRTPISSIMTPADDYSIAA